MARHSEVLIQGVNVPGGNFKVTVPVDSSYAADTARNIYPYDGAQYIWMKSWEVGQSSRGGGGSSSGAGMGPGTIVMGLIGLILVAGIGSAFEDDTAPIETPQAAPVERSYTPAPAATPSYANPTGPCVTANFEPC